MGQWSQGGMIMVGDMFNHGLKAQVDGLCSELANALRGQSLLVAPVSSQSQKSGRVQPVRAGWLVVLVAGGTRPAELDRRAERRALCVLSGYASACDRARRPAHGLRHRRPPDRRRLPAAGVRRLSHLHEPVRAGARGRPADRSTAESNALDAPGAVVAPVAPPEPLAGVSRPMAPPEPSPAPAAPVTSSADDLFDKIERLAALRAKGILTEEEFAAKKAELLARL